MDIGLEQSIQAQSQGHFETNEKRTAKVLLDDAGEKIGGARKDLWRLRGLSTQDLDSMSQEEQFANTTKANVWPPDWSALTSANGMPVEVAAFLKLLYDRIATNPTTGGIEARRFYVWMLTLFKRTCVEMPHGRIRALSSEIEKAKAEDITAVHQKTDYKLRHENAGLLLAIPHSLGGGRRLCSSDV